MAIKIDTGIPLPDPKTGGSKYPWKDMDIGHSFFVPEQVTATFKTQITNAQKRTGFRFTSRRVEGGIRVWRIA